ncbi:aquaporin-9 isoform X3 [Elephas maximus indicus]|uniref:aquaporin-9 isoform X3 n=1 Tax=Elephas maximus indicus TaxID=99487 RepID=UPI002116838C|nr:aquaporin-9 isoform X3 [Elephas maximus indicus]
MQPEKAQLGKSFKQKLVLKSSLAKETLSEFLGTFIMIVLGCGCIAQAILSRGHFGGIVTINVGFPMAVAMAIYVSGGVSDGLMSFAGGQLLVEGENATAHIFATYPAPYLSLTNAFADQVVATTFLLVVVFAIFDSRNMGVPRGLVPLVIGLLIVVIASSLGLNSGCAMNPARDLSPRLFTALAGWGTDVFTAGNNFWWIPVVGPMVGSIFGGLIYVLVIEIHHPDPDSGLKVEPSEDKAEPLEDKAEKYELSAVM